MLHGLACRTDSHRFLDSRSSRGTGADRFAQAAFHSSRLGAAERYGKIETSSEVERVSLGNRPHLLTKAVATQFPQQRAASR